MCLAFFQWFWHKKTKTLNLVLISIISILNVQFLTEIITGTAVLVIKARSKDRHLILNWNVFIILITIATVLSYYMFKQLSLSLPPMKHFYQLLSKNIFSLNRFVAYWSFRHLYFLINYSQIRRFVSNLGKTIHKNLTKIWAWAITTFCRSRLWGRIPIVSNI